MRRMKIWSTKGGPFILWRLGENSQTGNCGFETVHFSSNSQLFTPTYMLGLACAYELSRRLDVAACLKGCETIRYDFCEGASTSVSPFGFGSTWKNAQESEQRNAQSRKIFVNPGQELQSVFGCFSMVYGKPQLLFSDEECVGAANCWP